MSSCHGWIKFETNAMFFTSSTTIVVGLLSYAMISLIFVAEIDVEGSCSLGCQKLFKSIASWQTWKS